MAFDVQAIEDKIDKARTADIAISDDSSGISIKRLVDAMEVAKVLAVSKQAVPQFMRGEPGICYAAVIRAVRWTVDPFFVAENMFLARLKGGEERIGFQAHLINAVINLATSRILKGKLRCRYEGEGDTLKCIVFGTPKNENEPLEYETPTLGALIQHFGRNDFGKVKGSPLYDLDPKQQLWYYGSKNFIRKWFPEVLGGVYDRDDLEVAAMEDVTPKVEDQRTGLVQRLQDRKLRHAKRATRGFDHDHVTGEVGKATGNVIEGRAEGEAATQEEAKHGEKETNAAAGHDTGIQGEGGRTGADDLGHREQSVGSTGTDPADRRAADGPANGEGAQAEQTDKNQLDIFPGDKPLKTGGKS